MKLMLSESVFVRRLLGWFDRVESCWSAFFGIVRQKAMLMFSVSDLSAGRLSEDVSGSVGCRVVD